MHTTGAEPSGMHTRAACPLIKCHAVFADFIQPQRRRHRSNIDNVVRDVQRMVFNTRQFGKQYTQILRADGHFEIEQLFDSQNIAMLHRHRRRIIQPIKIRQSLQIGFILDQLFRTAVQKADMRV